MIEVVLKDLSAAFEPLSAVNFSYDRIETNPRFATIARPANAAILIRLRVDMEERGGSIELLLPYATLEPVRELLLQMFMGEKFGRDSIWEGHLATELWYTQVQIDAVLDEKVMELGQVMGLEVGDTGMFNSTRESEVELRCGDVPLLLGRMGRVGSTMAIRVTDQIRSGEKD
jgi:flagellar motor switch protein FliM